jgi:hypothetical protein
VRSSVCAVCFLVLSFFPIAPVANAEPEPPQSAASASQASASQSADAHPVLVELFTSEGCSSCPPADEMIQKLDELQPIPGAQLIVLSEHVTYWDQDGWKDPNSSAALTDRQAAYESALKEPSSYTPQIVVDGTAQIHIDYPQQQMTDIFEKAAAKPKVPVRIGEVTVAAGSPTVLHAHIETDVNSEQHAGDVYVAVALNHIESQVLKGENGGKHLIHVAVVQQLTKVGKLVKGKAFSQDVQLKLAPGTDPKNVRLVAFVQESGPGYVLGAAQRKPAS